MALSGRTKRRVCCQRWRTYFNRRSATVTRNARRPASPPPTFRVSCISTGSRAQLLCVEGLCCLLTGGSLQMPWRRPAAVPVALLSTYAKSMTQGSVAGGRSPPYIGENIHPDEGYWIARQQMFWGGQRNENSPEWGDEPTAPTADRERSVDYMHR